MEISSRSRSVCPNYMAWQLEARAKMTDWVLQRRSASQGSAMSYEQRRYHPLAVVDNQYNVVGNISNVDVKVNHNSSPPAQRKPIHL
jgi:hypothetical protein